MKIAVIGAGFAGLAAVWFLFKKKPDLGIHLFDASPPGGLASRISAGICHPYGGLKSRLNRHGVEGLAKMEELLSELDDEPPLILSRKILRLALNHQQLEDFYSTSQTYDDVEWLEPEQCQRIIPNLPDAPGLMIHSGLTIDAPAYTKRLFAAAQTKGDLQFFQEEIKSLSALQGYDAIICTCGAATLKFSEFDALGFRPNKGQLLELEWPASLPPLPISLVSQVYLSMGRDKNTVSIGATYERGYVDESADASFAIKELLPKAIQLLPGLEGAKIKSVKSGLRLSTPTHLPFAGQVGKSLWCLAGFGSRGLLYHALYADKLVNQLFSL